MLKVIVADDEIKVCQLIEKLVDWHALDMEIVAVANNGIEAVQLIEQYRPEVVITDIRMPGYDGLEMIRRAKEISSDTEFIVISGYRHFEYAQSAIKYGVVDYLLKPIKKMELTDTLTKIRSMYMQNKQQLSYEETVLLNQKNDEEKSRTRFLAKVLYSGSKDFVSSDITEVNQEYAYHFQAGAFQMICIKVDDIEEDYSNLEFITKKITQSVQEYLKPYCFDVELYFENSRSFSILNYAQEDCKTIRRQLKTILDKVLLQESIFENMKVTIGMGSVVNSICELRNSYKYSVWAMEQRLLVGVNRVIEGDSIVLTDIPNSDLFTTFNKEIGMAMERLDPVQVKTVVLHLKETLLQRPGITGHELLQMTKEACNLYIFFLKNNQLYVEQEENLLEYFNAHVRGIYSIDTLFSYLIQTITSSLAQIAERKQQEDNRPIRTAKQYMQQHYNESITLEEVSSEVGFNTTYFSSLFKKETGKTFLEYLSELRMTKAKELLKTSKMSVASICTEVGYSDVKHFTKSFTKHTGLKPSEFRKLYS